MKENAEHFFNTTDLTEEERSKVLFKVGRNLIDFSNQIFRGNPTLEWRVKVLVNETGYSDEFIYKAISTFLYQSLKGRMVII